MRLVHYRKLRFNTKLVTVYMWGWDKSERESYNQTNKQTNKTRHGCRVLTSGTSTVSYIMKCIMRGPHSPHAALDLRSGHWCIPQRSKSHMCITSLITVSYQGSCRSKRWSRASECIVFLTVKHCAPRVRSSSCRETMLLCHSGFTAFKNQN